MVGNLLVPVYATAGFEQRRQRGEKGRRRDARTWGAGMCCALALLGGLLLFAFGMSVLGYQGLEWSRHGMWSSLRFRLVPEWLGLSPPVPSWHGAEQVMVWLLQSPLWADAIAIGLILFALGSRCARATT